MDVLTFHFVAKLREADVLARLEAAEAKIAALEAELQRRKGGRPKVAEAA